MRLAFLTTALVLFRAAPPASAELALEAVGATQRGLKLFEKLAHKFRNWTRPKNLGASQLEGYHSVPVAQ